MTPGSWLLSSVIFAAGYFRLVLQVRREEFDLRIISFSFQPCERKFNGMNHFVLYHFM